ncbi:hypothetical protein B0H16DRAFT_1507709 [Mycena metata]|uniref:Uncharacterized protein n=1 Tax=Mycena metata TaxID=1033252 RepID=A0AAD7K2H9_9AGAR|nr:hypothetical protein B0H16DRAFT_1507709 [Mycena metata]
MAHVMCTVSLQAILLLPWSCNSWFLLCGSRRQAFFKIKDQGFRINSTPSPIDILRCPIRRCSLFALRHSITPIWLSSITPIVCSDCANLARIIAPIWLLIYLPSGHLLRQFDRPTVPIWPGSLHQFGCPFIRPRAIYCANWPPVLCQFGRLPAPIWLLIYLASGNILCVIFSITVFLIYA